MDIRASLQRAWRLRLNQEVDACRALVASVESGLPGDVNHSSFANWAQIILLKVSLDRVQGDFARAEARFAELIHTAERLGLAVPARYFMEKGLNHLAQSDQFAALDCFLKCYASSHGDMLLSLQARINELICLEHLDLPRQDRCREFAKLIKTYEASRVYSGIVDQWQAMQMRDYWRNGDISSMRKAKPRPEFQGHFFRNWCFALPFLRSGNLPKRAAQHFRGPRRIYFESYRLRTLEGLAHPDDIHVSKVSEKIDRLYLWTWYWLRDPNRFPLQKVGELIESVHVDLNRKPLGFEDSLMLRNALKWICLFDQGQEKAVAQLLHRINFSRDASSYQTLEIEFLVVNLFLAMRDRQSSRVHDLSQLIHRHPLYTHKDFLFAEIERSVRLSQSPPKGLEKLVENLKRLLNPADQSAELVVDTDRNEVFSVAFGQRTVSQSLVRALQLFKRQTNVSAFEFMHFVFDIPDYDAFIHAPKIYNLLGRLRTFLPAGQSVHFRSERVYFDGNWAGIALKGGQTELRLGRVLRNPIEAQPVGHRSLPDEMLLLPKEFSRRDIEKILARPRSTVNRLLKKWLTDGLIASTGRARQTKYKLVSERKI